MTGPVAIVTGGSQGMGFAVAERLLRDGLTVVVNSRQPTAAADRLSALGPVVPVAGDLADAGTTDRLIAAVERLGRLDALLLNHGGPGVKPLLEVDDAQWESNFRLMVTGPLRLLRTAVPLMQRSGGGRVVAITSFCVKTPYPGLGVSGSLRAALVNALKTLAIELGPDQILINSVAPGYVATERLVEWNRVYASREHAHEDEIAARTTGQIPMRRYGTAAEIASLIGFLLSPANGYVTGQQILADGGLVTAL